MFSTLNMNVTRLNAPQSFLQFQPSSAVLAYCPWERFAICQHVEQGNTAVEKINKKIIILDDYHITQHRQTEYIYFFISFCNYSMNV